MKKIKAIHYCVIPKSNNNAGDNLLYILVRNIINGFINNYEIQWILKSQWKVSSALEINSLDSDFVLFGGGGLFLPDQKEALTTNETGWQINLSSKEYELINPNFYGVAIGFNWFRKSNFPKNIIKESSNSFIKHSNFIGLRNYGSIKQLQSITKTNKKIHWIPCATTIIKKLCEFKINVDFPVNLEKIMFTKDISSKQIYNIAFNFSCDRLDQRNISEDDIKKFIMPLKMLRNKGHKIFYLAHKNLDLKACNILGNELFDEIINISNFSSEDVFKRYLNFDIVFGGRGHSLMIPFGLGIPVVSLTSHDKQMYFMEDACLSEFSIEIKNLQIEILIEKILWCLDNIEKQIKLIDNYQIKGLRAWELFAKKIINDLDKR